MSDSRISDLIQGTPLDTDVIPYVDGVSGTTKKALKSELKGDKGDTGNTGATGNPGTNGTDAFVYIAYADDGSGTGFTLTFNSTKDYIAVLSTDTEIPSPIVSDFAGLWKKYKGEPGASAVAGELPSSYVETSTPVGTTSASLEDISGMSTTITLDETVNIAVMASMEIATQSGASSSTIAFAININGVDHDQTSRFLSGSNDIGMGSIVHRTTTALAAGTYTVKLRFRRVSGTATPGINRADLLVMAMQGAKGTDATGDVVGPVTNTDNYIPQWNGTDTKTLKNGLILDTDLSSVSASDDSLPSAKATKTALDLKATLASPSFTGTVTLPKTVLGEVSMQLDPALSADGTWSGITETGTAGATLAFGELCYFQASDSRWELVDANVSAGYDKKLGICVLAAASDGSATEMLLIGKIRADSKFPTFTIGSPVYMGETAGTVVVTQPSTADVCIRVCGFGNTADELYFNPSNDYVIHT